MQRDFHTAAAAGLQKGLASLLAAQDPVGCWKGRYNGPLFLIPGLVAAYEVTGAAMPGNLRSGVRNYLCQHQNPDGGWGLHLEDASRVYATVTCYVAARLCGLEAGSRAAAAARAWMRTNGDARHMAPWGKYLLALLGLYDFRGLLPLPPELWLLPRWLPLHPGRLWNHSRMVYLPLSYLYGRRHQGRGSPLLGMIREEIFSCGGIPEEWGKTVFLAGERDVYRPLRWPFRWISRLLLLYERRPVGAWRQRALDFVYDQVRQEDENTHFLCVGPVSKIFNLLVRNDREPGGAALEAHWRALETYLCHEPEGISLHGYNHSRLWDTAFALQAVAAAAPRTSRESLRPAWTRGLGYVRSQQIWDETAERERYFRDRSLGGWPFSDALHGWPISDCTAEGLKVCLERGFGEEPEFAPERRDAAVDRILEWQNPDGGWPTYERIRAPGWLEALNPSLVFADIMVDHSHVECTAACLQALGRALPEVDPHRQRRILRAQAAGSRFLRRRQRRDGSWMGAWGVCFTYGTWFGVWGLRAAGTGEDGNRLQRAAAFLCGKQLGDGGWAETVENCRTGRYLALSPPSHPVKTAWAVLALTRCGRGYEGTVEAGLRFLLDSQAEDGSWPEEPLNGVFNRTCAIRYDNYRRIFPVWAIAEGLSYLERGAGEVEKPPRRLFHEQIGL